MSRSTVWAIIGGGNGGQSLAGHLSIMGYKVRLYDVFQATVDAINAQGGIIVDGVVEGFGKPELVTTDIGKAIAGADVVMVVAPATAHKTIAKNCAAHLTDGQIVIIHPGATCGALEFRHVLDQLGCTARVAVAETNSLIYACRSPKPGHASILGIKDDLVVATLPACENARALSVMQEAFPQIVGGKNVIETSLGNANAIMHPTPTLLNTSLIESRHDWLYYWEGITPELVKVLKKNYPVWINTHFNHPREITTSSRRALRLLADAGISLGNQAVLLAGVNDSPGIIKSLVRTLVANRVRPYATQHPSNLSAGLSNFRTSIGKESRS